MAFSSQLLKAPSITSRPKLSKTSVSSSIFRGAKSPVGSSTTIKIPKGMGYGGKAGTVDPKYLQTKITPIDQTLAETNNILVEIQKQLAFDYAMRIEDEKNAIKSIKAAESKRKFAAKEKSVEGIKKIGGAIGGTISKIAAPIKGIFDKIKEFFGLILTGIITNAAFTWLQDENNIKTLGNIFTFIGKTIPYLLAGLLGLKLIKWGTRLFRLGRFLFKLPGRILRVFGIGRRVATGKTATGRVVYGGGLFRDAAGQRRGRTTSRLMRNGIPQTRSAALRGGGGIRSVGVAQYATEKSLFNKTIQGLEVTGKKFGRNFLKVLGAGPGKKTLVKSLLKFARPILKRIPIVGALIDFALSVALGENPGRAAFGAIGAALLGTIGTFLGGPIGTFIGGLAGDFAGRQLYDLFFNKSSSKDVAKEQQESAVKSGKINRRGRRVGYSSGGTVPGSAIYASNGMTVPGRGSRNVDSVSAMLAPGEEVVRTASARLFRPLLKDINDNAGRLWTAFSMGINKLLMVSKYQDDVNKEFSKVIEDQDRYQRNLKTKRLSEATGGGSRSPARFTPKAPKVTNVNVVSQSGGGMTFLPMVLPTQKSKPPQIPQMQSPATEAPNISSVNPGNPFMMLTPELYGIG